jgi:ribonuclease P protein component
VAEPTGRFRPSDRVLRASEYQHVAQQGRRAVSNAFVVVVAKRARAGPPRLGITASRRVGGAVERNRVKRRVREWFRRERGSLRGSLDVVVIARRPAVALDAIGFGEQLSRLVARAAEDA